MSSTKILSYNDEDRPKSMNRCSVCGMWTSKSKQTDNGAKQKAVAICYICTQRKMHEKYHNRKKWN